MIVTSSRNAAILYKEQLDKLEGPESAVIISGDHNDEKKFWEHTDDVKQKKQIEDFKKPLGTGKGQSNLSILIVKDMLLTGFDAPIAQVMYLDRKITDHTLLQAIARVNRTKNNKFRGYIVDYFGLSDYLTEALDMFSTEDVQGALIEFKEELPKLKNAHTRVLKHFDDVDLNDLDASIRVLKDDIKRQSFQTDFNTFSRQLDVILPDPSATKFLGDLKKLGKIAIGARNLYRDERLDINGVGEKVKELIEEHIYATGVDPKIPPIDLLAPDYKEKLNEHKNDQSKASEIGNALKHHININLDEDPEYYKKLSERLEDIIQKHEERWDEMVQLLLDLRDNIEDDHKKEADTLGLSQTELSSYNILISEIGDEKNTDAATIQKAKVLVGSLVELLDEASQIVDFFNKWDEQKRMKKNIKHLIIENFDESLVDQVSSRFLDLAKTKFNK
jgi:type I restriction enzyme R subunit